MTDMRMDSPDPGRCRSPGSGDQRPRAGYAVLGTALLTSPLVLPFALALLTRAPRPARRIAAAAIARRSRPPSGQVVTVQ